MAYTNKYVSDIPLKRPQETFVDDPKLFDEVLLEELEFDLAHGVKDINGLHVFHAIVVFHAMLEDLIWLREHPEELRVFRESQLKKYGLVLGELEEGEDGDGGFHGDDLAMPVQAPAPAERIEAGAGASQGFGDPKDSSASADEAGGSRSREDLKLAQTGPETSQGGSLDGFRPSLEGQEGQDESNTPQDHLQTSQDDPTTVQDTPSSSSQREESLSQPTPSRDHRETQNRPSERVFQDSPRFGDPGDSQNRPDLASSDSFPPKSFISRPGMKSLDSAFSTVDSVSTPDEPQSGLGTPDPLDPVEFISTELLVQTTSLERVPNPITTHSSSRLRKEVLFHSNPKTKAQAEHLVKCFGLARPPPISIKEFLLRINKYSPSVSVSVYIHSAYLLFKLGVLLDVVGFTELNVYRFILALIRSLTKKCEDIYQKQKSFAMVGGMALRDLGKIEVSFLYLCNFKLVVSEFILNDFLKNNFVDLRSFCRERKGNDESMDVEEAAQ